MMNRENSRIFEMFGVNEESPEWNDWHWQYNNRIMDADRLSCVIGLSEAEKADISVCLERFRMAMTPYYASLIDPDDPNDPIRAQAVPSVNETQPFPWDMADPLNEDIASPVKNMVHRYSDRALFLVTQCCSMYCRHCTRRRLVGEEDDPISDEEINESIEYIRKKPEIRDVLVSGGDPLTLSDDRLETIFSQLREIEHVEIIRIGTRVPVTMPMRVTSALLSMLKKYQPIWINTHFNHPTELTRESIKACAEIVDAGIPLGNQSVLLKGINDNTETIKALMLGLVKARVRPYYLYQCDMSVGLHHFRTDVRTGIKIIGDLTGSITGFAIPKFVIDAPGGGGKIPINPEYIVSIDDEKVVMRNNLGQIYEYPQP
ncbi:MAG: KamA family radical SAM protein [Eubacteriaceae bacterium]|nr:KamA family radical SAM protein [Eubacteriaceae bacterium]